MTSENDSRPARTQTVLALFGIWLSLATLVGAAGTIERSRPPAPQVVLLVLTGLLIAAGLGIRPFRAWLRQVDLRGVVAIHLTRLVELVRGAVHSTVARSSGHRA